MTRTEPDRRRLFLDLVAILGVSFLVTLPILIAGIPRGNDLPQHYQFAVAFRDSVSRGVVFPAWSPDVNGGFGDVGVRFYPPLSYYVLDVISALVGSWFYGSVLTFCLLFFVGAVGVYLWARTFFGSGASVAGAIAYIVVPYHVNQIYNAFTFAEFAAAAILPFVFLFMTRVARRGDAFDQLGLAVSYGALVLTHLPLAVIGSIAIVIYGLVSLERGTWPVTMLRMGSSAALGLLASAFYWVRMATELAFLNHDALPYQARDYDFRHNFLLSYFYVSSDQYAERSLLFLDLLLIVTMAMTVSGIVVYVAKAGRIGVRPIVGPIVVLAVSLFFATPLSLPLWNLIPILQKTQFPWRWLTIVGVAGAICVAAGVEKLREAAESKLRPLAIVFCGLSIAAAVFTATQVIRPAIFIERSSFDEMVNGLRSAQSYKCWWPISARESAFANTTRASVAGGSATIEKWEPTEREFYVDSPGMVRVATFYYPNWHAYVNGREVPVGYDDDGAILLQLTGNESEVELRFVEPTIEIAASYVSVATWFVIFASLLVVVFYRRKLRLK